MNYYDYYNLIKKETSKIIGESQAQLWICKSILKILIKIIFLIYKNSKNYPIIFKHINIYNKQIKKLKKIVALHVSRKLITWIVVDYDGNILNWDQWDYNNDDEDEKKVKEKFNFEADYNQVNRNISKKKLFKPQEKSKKAFNYTNKFKF